MSIIIRGAAYMALIYEGYFAFLTLINLVSFAQHAKKFEFVEVLQIFEKMCSLFCFGIMAVGITTRNRGIVKIWLCLSYCQIKWYEVTRIFVSFYGYLNTEKFTDKSEFMHVLRNTYAPLIAQVLAKIGIILMVYRFYKTLQKPQKKTKLQLAKMAAEQKVE